MNRIQVTTVMILAMLTGCENKEAQPGYKGEITFSSEKILSGESYLVYGYSFEKGTFLPYPAPGEDKPDILVINETDNMNNITGAVLSSPDNSNAFHLDGTFGTQQQATAFFDAYTQVTDSVFSGLSEKVDPNQVWTFQTTAGQFAKLLVEEVTVKTDSKVQDYVEVRVAFHFQPDGTRNFDN